MRMPAVFKNAGLLFVLLWLAFFSIEAQAAIDNAGVLDNVLNRYSAAASGWAGFITARATWLFWTLAVILIVIAQICKRGVEIQTENDLTI